MFVPLWVLAPLVLLLVWALFAANGRNLLPFPDPGSRIFAARSPAAQDAIVHVLERHGVKQRYWGNTAGVRRAILWDWTIISCPTEAVAAQVDGASSSIGVVADDPRAAAEAAAEFLRGRGFSARVVPDAEPEIPICHVVTDALRGTTLNFRRHAVRFPMPQPLSHERRS
jgi:hypothetical protein